MKMTVEVDIAEAICQGSSFIHQPIVIYCGDRNMISVTMKGSENHRRR